MNRRAFLTALAAPAFSQSGVTRFVRYRRGNAVTYGILEGDAIQPIRGDLFGAYRAAGSKVKLADVKLLVPCEPQKVLALAGNYKSHMGSNALFRNPEVFYKPLSCLQNPEDPIELPKDSTDVHYEGELVVVIGKPARRVSVAEARDVIFGFTCGNDVSERVWQNGAKKDVQWWRAKGADTFGPMGPCIARGVDASRLMLRTRVNGQEVQKESTGDLLFDSPTMVSFISQYVTLAPGDLIFTGTPQTTKPLKAGDVVEVDIEGIGVLRNKVTAAS